MPIRPTDLFAALAHDTRLRCLMLLVHFGELCVCELTHPIGAAQPHISRHLAQLRELGLVTDRRQGLWIYYRIRPGLPGWVADLLDTTYKGVAGRAPFADDVRTLSLLLDRPGVPRCA